MLLARSHARFRSVRGAQRATTRSGRAEVPWEMGPLRCGAGEAGAFHPLCEAVQTIRAKPNCASVSCLGRAGGQTRLGGWRFNLFDLRVGGREFSRRRGLNSLFGHATLRIPLRLVSRPAQEERDECTSLKNLL